MIFGGHYQLDIQQQRERENRRSRSLAAAQTAVDEARLAELKRQERAGGSELDYARRHTRFNFLFIRLFPNREAGREARNALTRQITDLSSSLAYRR